MTTIGEHAQAYEPKRMKNIADLEVVSVSQEIKTEVRKDKDNADYEVAFINLPNEEGKIEEYRVPNSVAEQLKTMMAEKPEMTSFKVTKKGEGLNTTYQVVPLD
ncbi:hypothetical protein LCGC14_1011890 [marine sediment metagenome]|uniref:Uncharacterized protein n=1 Tax=marine sediment metagenome TaxID=412755 RepID=A0A0F9R647_9ZZZZ